jgi:hypothetical protein
VIFVPWNKDTTRQVTELGRITLNLLTELFLAVEKE